MNKYIAVHVSLKLKIMLLIIISAAIFASSYSICYAEGTILSDFSSELLFQQDFHVVNGVVQAVCADENYIYTIENVGDDASKGDVISAYYKNTTDENGNIVQQYSLARSDDTQHLEHGNGLTYNPNTRQLFVAPYTSVDAENRGCLIVIDPDSLKITGRVKISDSYNILSVSYDRINDVYYIQTNDEGQYDILKLDANFNIIEELGAEDPTPGYNFQAFCVSGDYLLQSPLTLFLSNTNYVMAYSINGGDVEDCVAVDFGLSGYVQVEPEQIARLDDTSFILVMNATRNDGTGTAFFYKITFPNLPINDTLFANDVETQDTSEVQSNTEADETTNDIQDDAQNTYEEVKITHLQDLVVGRNSRTIDKKNIMPILSYIIPLIAAAAFAWYVNIVRIKRKRRKKRAASRQLRKESRIRAERVLRDIIDDQDDDL